MCEPEPAQAGTEFPPSVKQEPRKRAAFTCCYCREHMGDNVPHLTPKEEGGQGADRERRSPVRPVTERGMSL